MQLSSWNKLQITIKKIGGSKECPDIWSDNPIDDLRLACYLVAIHSKVEDSLVIWNAKDIDFDTHCGLDIQLAVGAGVEKTIEYLRSLNVEAAKRALKYLIECKEAGDFEDIEAYFSLDNLPYYV